MDSFGPPAAPPRLSPGMAGRSRFNISRWALEHPALTRYLMIVLLALGVAAYFQLGQDEDPPFTFRVMVVQAYWPGASAQQMAEQVTDKIEKTLQEVPYADKIRSYTKPGESVTILQLADSSPASAVPNSWYQARKRVGDMRHTLPAGVVGPVFNDDFGDVYGSIFALSADGFSPEELRVFADRVRQQLLKVPDVAKVETFGAQAEKIFIEISQKRLAQLGLDMNQVIAQLGAQNAVEGAGVLNAGSENLQVRVAGQFNSVEELERFPIRAVNPATGAASMLRLGDLAEVKREVEVLWFVECYTSFYARGQDNSRATAKLFHALDLGDVPQAGRTILEERLELATNRLAHHARKNGGHAHGCEPVRRPAALDGEEAPSPRAIRVSL